MRFDHLCYFFVLIFVSFATSSDTSAVEGEISVLKPVPPPLKVGLKTYFIQTFTTANWFRALQFCRYQEMQLASIENQEEQLALSQHLNNTGLSETFWISGSNLSQNDTWVWYSNGNTAIYQSWDDYEPNNSGGSEQCIEFRPSSFHVGEHKWNDKICSYELYFICEKV